MPTVRFATLTGKNLALVLRSGSTYWNNTASALQSPYVGANHRIAMTELTGDFLGLYEGTTNAVTDGVYVGTIHDTDDSNNILGVIEGRIFADAFVPSVDTIAISGDSVAADRFETMLDGTGGNTLSLGQLKVVANVGGEGAIHATNAHIGGYGSYNYGLYGQYNYAVTHGQVNQGGVNGQNNDGGVAGQHNHGVSYDVQCDATGVFVGTTNVINASGLAGKVLGGGAGVITGVGVRADDRDGAAIAKASIFTGITALAQWLGLIAGKQVGDSTARTELRASGAGSGTYDETTDSLQAQKDAGGGGGDATLANQTLLLAKLNPARNVVANAVAQDNVIEVVEGSSYLDAQGRALTWSITDIDLTAATVSFAYIATLDYEADTGSFTAIGTGSVSAYGSGINTVEVELTSAETAGLTLTTPPNDKYAYTYRLTTTLGGYVRHEVIGGMTVKRGA